MKVVIQRVKNAEVNVQGNIIGSIKKGLLIFLGIGENDSEKECDYIIDKMLNLRIFEDIEQKMNRSVIDINGDVLIVSQFTLYGDCAKGRRPSFTNAMNSKDAKKIYTVFIDKLKKAYQSTGANGKIATGRFQAEMDVSMVNDGPVTLIMEV